MSKAGSTRWSKIANTAGASPVPMFPAVSPFPWPAARFAGAARRGRRWVGLLAAALVAAGPLGAQTGGDLPPIQVTPLPVCFPPSAPILGDEILNEVAPGIRRFSRNAPAELADYVGEWFYPALSSRLMEDDLGRRLASRLDAYRNARGALLNELTEKLVTLNQADEAARAAALRELAAAQRPRILALEKEAEDLRRELISGGLMDWNVHWSRDRGWRVGNTRFAADVFEQEARFQVVRAAAFYYDGLLPEQRALLLEAAMELRTRARAIRPPPPTRKEDPRAMFFSPATARLRLPANLSPALTEKIGHYNREKAELKNELRDAVLAHDSSWTIRRNQALVDLAERQEPRLAALDRLAEEIRAGLSAVRAAPLAAPPQIPPSLIQRIEGYNRDRRVIMREFESAVQAAEQRVERPQLDRSMPTDERENRVRQYAAERAAAREKVSAQFQESAKDRLEEMRQRYVAIREDLALVASSQFDRETGKPFDADSLLRAYTSAMEKYDAFGREEVIYRGYRLAMLLPGLSREQRRLLFNAVMVGLAQPLPPSEQAPRGQQPEFRS